MANFADVSHHQPTFDVGTYALHRRTVALKATEGTGFTDPTFRTRWQAAKGLRRIAYHFARAKFNGADEFAHCWAVVRPAGFDPRTDVIALDIEDPDTPSRAAANAKEFTRAAVNAGLTFGLVYSYPTYARDNGIVANLFPAGWRRLWFAEYSNREDTAIILPPGWISTQYYARQYTDKALVAGVGICDDNRIVRDWLQPSPTTPEDSMAGWSDQDSANLQRLADRMDAIWRSGFASVGTDGQPDPTHLAVSVAGVVNQQRATNGHLEGMHMILGEIAQAAADAFNPPVPPAVPEAPPVPEMDQAPPTPEPGQ